MNKENLFKFLMKIITLFSFLILFLIIIFIVKEAFPLFKEISVKEFLFGKNWRPYSSIHKMGIWNIILATIYIAVLGVLIALPIGIGSSLFLACMVSKKIRDIIKPFIDILAGIPSVIYGFIGLIVIVKSLEKLGRTSGESVLAGGILLSIMVLPFIISICEESMSKLYIEYEIVSKSLGVSKYYFISEIVLPNSIKSIIISTVLAFGRALGETMAVMMVIGNAPIFPTLFGKAQTISSLIALEMGMVEVGSPHYNALFASGVVLMGLLLMINILINIFKYKLMGDKI
ncbi:phosphate ABC transporter permease subunit PstC [uncultured Fusobacterium sp.]|mgnify:FL=1|uniref:phosphate ABC transporter permease subunit PstC n=1 Tax=uncultured Fusobacterium sp. TaxID=159267 RepID=UPI0025D5AEEC|nr:phosphate ABC transporter permease subunit PstC [uncultured Fusobacterium sp.]